jgi:hypothetical protein
MMTTFLIVYFASLQEKSLIPCYDPNCCVFSKEPQLFHSQQHIMGFLTSQRNDYYSFQLQL